MVVVSIAEAPPPDLALAPIRILALELPHLFGTVLESALVRADKDASVACVTTSELVASTSIRCDLVVAWLGATADEASERLRIARKAAPRTPLVALCDGTDMGLLVRALAADAAGCLTAQMEPETFVQVFDLVRAGHRIICPALLEHLLESVGSNLHASEMRQGGLSRAELDVLRLLGQLHSVTRVADVRKVSPKTVRNHLARIHKKLGVRTRAELILYAVRAGLISTATG